MYKSYTNSTIHDFYNFINFSIFIFVLIQINQSHLYAQNLSNTPSDPIAYHLANEDSILNENFLFPLSNSILNFDSGAIEIIVPGENNLEQLEFLNNQSRSGQNTLFLRQRVIGQSQKKYINSMGRASILLQPTYPPEQFTLLTLSFKLCFSHSLENISLPLKYRDYNYNESKFKYVSINSHYETLQSSDCYGYRIQLNFLKFSDLVLGSDLNYSIFTYKFRTIDESVQFGINNYSWHIYAKYPFMKKPRFTPFFNLGFGYLYSYRNNLKIIQIRNNYIADDPDLNSYEFDNSAKTYLWSPQLFTSISFEFKPQVNSSFVYKSELLLYYNLNNSGYINQTYVYVSIGIGFTF